MKLRSTTPVSVKKKATRITLIAAALVMAVSAPIATGMFTDVFARNYDAEIKAVEKKISAYEKEAKKLSSEANTLKNELSKLASEKALIQSKIDLSQKRYDKLQSEIKENEKKIKQNKNALGETIADLYVNSNTSVLEMLASSSNIADYIDKQTQQNTVKDELTRTIDKIQKLQDELNNQKKDAKRVLDDQKNQRAQLAQKEQERQSVLDKTKGKESAYRSLVKKSQKRIDKIKEDQAQYFQSLNPSVGGISSGDPNKGGYPSIYANSPQDTVVDRWGMYNRECVSYTAWKVHQKTGKMPYWGGRGNAWQWAFSGYSDANGLKYSYKAPGTHWHSANAQSAGIATGSTPRVGSVAVRDANPSAGDPFGHVAWVEKVSGGKIYISQYNWYNAGGSGWGHYSEMWVSKSFFGKYIYF